MKKKVKGESEEEIPDKLNAETRTENSTGFDEISRINSEHRQLTCYHFTAHLTSSEKRQTKTKSPHFYPETSKTKVPSNLPSNLPSIRKEDENEWEEWRKNFRKKKKKIRWLFGGGGGSQGRSQGGSQGGGGIVILLLFSLISIASAERKEFNILSSR